MRQPVSLSRTPSAIARHTPERGEHTDEVLAEFGFSADEIEELKTSWRDLAQREEMPDMTDKMLSRKEGGVGYVIFNNPERHNAVSLEMWEATRGHPRRFPRRQRSAWWC